MTSRYNTRRLGVNDTELYSKVREERNVKTMRQYFTPNLKHPTAKEISRLKMTHLFGGLSHGLIKSQQKVI
jgi:hypothetical protein